MQMFQKSKFDCVWSILVSVAFSLWNSSLSPKALQYFMFYFILFFFNYSALWILISVFLHSDVYPDGLPTEYSIITTFKVNNDTAQTSWNLWQVSDPKGREQVGLRFHPDGQSLDFFYTGPQGTQMVRTFQGLQKLFNRKWHKLALSVKGSQVRLLIDCKEIRVESIDEPRPVIRQGYTSIVKRAARDRSASVCCNLES